MNNIILIGFMGSGKSTIGAYMEDKDYILIDTDECIEKDMGTPISEIFASKGEEYFRNLETECIRALIEKNTDKAVVSVGGGLPMREENQVLLKELGKIVYLRATVDTLVGRLTGDTKRPLLQGGDLRQKITDLFAKREETYEKLADVIIDTDNCSLEEIYTGIMEAL